LHRQTSFPVAVNGRAHGILTLADLKSLPREKWHSSQVKDFMRPINQQLFVTTLVTLESATELMKEAVDPPRPCAEKRALLIFPQGFYAFADVIRAGLSLLGYDVIIANDEYPRSVVGKILGNGLMLTTQRWKRGGAADTSNSDKANSCRPPL